MFGNHPVYATLNDNLLLRAEVLTEQFKFDAALKIYAKIIKHEMSTGQWGGGASQRIGASMGYLIRDWAHYLGETREVTATYIVKQLVKLTNGTTQEFVYWLTPYVHYRAVNFY